MGTGSEVTETLEHSDYVPGVHHLCVEVRNGTVGDWGEQDGDW